MSDLDLLSDEEKQRTRYYAMQAALFRSRYGAELPGTKEDFAGMVTAHFIEAFVHETEKNRRRGATRLRIGPLVEEDRGEGGNMPQLHSGKQLRAPLSGTDIDGAPADVSGATATSSDESQVTARIEPSTTVPGGVDLVVSDASGGNLGSASVTVSAGAATLTENFEVIAGDAVALNLGAFAEENRP